MLQLHFPGMGDMATECDFQCLTNCPMEPFGKDCLYDDPDIGMFDLVEYPEFFSWRFEQIFGNSDEFLEVTPDMMEEYFKEPEDSTQTRCPRCLSVEVTIGYPYMECRHCGYNEPLIDFPISRYYHFAFGKIEFNDKSQGRSYVAG